MAIDLNTDSAAGPTQRLAAARWDLDRCGAAVVSWLVPAAVRYAVAAEAIRLAAQVGVRRDLAFAETGFTPRRMRNAKREQIAEHGSTIRRVYESGAVSDAIAAVVGQAVYRCPYEPEQFVITQLDRPGDTHG